MIPALLGNLVGGCLMVATMYWYLNLSGEPPVAVDGVEYEEVTERLMGYPGQTTNPPHSESSSSKGEKGRAEDMV